MTTRTRLAYAAAAVVLVLGLLALLNPLLGVRLVGLEVVAPRGLSQARAVFGALFVTMAGVLLWAIPQRPDKGAAVRAIGVLWTGIAAGRAASVAIDGVVTLGNLAWLLLEAGVAALLLWGSLETPPSGAELRARRELAAARRRAAGDA